ncbi:U-box domain-containing protein 35 [Apostasia shenzhenica]|uniref:RING-type E3 ubiquitin transferase n=1 Tax=Apostasia shenzhenica TaxID=1088818 RepID=A0A2I0AQQ6_9ASPA|nr:U-box domain-containing protein 35 [Apostasia shenzhenica]
MKDADVASFPLVAVAINKDKNSHNALKWAIENLVSKGQTLTLVHVNSHKTTMASHDNNYEFKGAIDPLMKELFLPFRCFCARKDIHCKDVVLEDTDVAKAIVEFVSQAAIEKLVVGAPSHGGFIRRFKSADVATHISKGAPDFCTVYVISKGKVLSVRNAVRPAPTISPLRAQIDSQFSMKPSEVESNRFHTIKGDMTPRARNLHDESIKSPFTRGSRGKSYADLSLAATDISFVTSGRPSIDKVFQPRASNASDGVDHSFESVCMTPLRSAESYSFGNEFSSTSGASSATSWSSQAMVMNKLETISSSLYISQDDVEAEMKRLRMELKQTMNMYNNACKEALLAKQKAVELHQWKIEEEHKLEEAKHAEELAMALVEREKAKCKAAMEAAEAQQRIAELEAQKRRHAETQALKEAEEKKKAMDYLAPIVRYRKYSIEEIEVATNYFAENLKIGEGGYGPVYKCFLDHTPVAVKVLRPDAAQGRTQFQQEVEVLSCIRHPNMVLLLGACPEYGCLVYEYMANGSLDDRLFRRNNTPPLPWQHRFRVAAEIATALLFLHQTKPEPIVHRDLKPANILLDLNFVSKISDVGLARLVPPSVADSVTQYRMTSTAGTFCYIDPEYQQTGMLGVKSDVYSLGILLLQLLTARPPMGLAHHVSRALEARALPDLLDPAVPDWPLEETARLAQIALQCAELRRKDRPDLATAVLPELNRMRAMGEDRMQFCLLSSSPATHGCPQTTAVSDPLIVRQTAGFDCSRAGTNSNGRRSNVI